MKNRNKFRFRLQYIELIKELDESAQLAMYRAVVKYGLFHEQPNFQDMAQRVVWRSIQQGLDLDWAKYENGCKGGAPIGNKNAMKHGRYADRRGRDSKTDDGNKWGNLEDYERRILKYGEDAQ